MVRQGLSPSQIVEQFDKEGLNRTDKAINRKLEKERAKDLETWHGQIAAPPESAPQHDEAMEIEAERVLIVTDIHAPRHDHRWMNQVISLALKWGVDTVIDGGDLIDWDAFSFYGKDIETLAEDELNAATQIVEILSGEFAKVYIIDGNHNRRIVRKLEGLLSPSVMAGLWIHDKKNVTSSDYSWCKLTSGGELYYIEHPKNVSRDVSDTFWAIESGVCADPKRLSYIQKVHNTRPQVSQGAVIVIEGAPILLSPRNIDLYSQMTI
jgi:predicted phosphodiesterase